MFQRLSDFQEATALEEKVLGSKYLKEDACLLKSEDGSLGKSLSFVRSCMWKA